MQVAFRRAQTATSDFSRFSDLVPKLRRKDELSLKALSSVQRAKRCGSCSGREKERKFLEFRSGRGKKLFAREALSEVMAAKGKKCRTV